MPTSKLCLGPYNDPAGVTGTKYHDLPHEPNYHNPAFLVATNGDGGSYVARVAVRNMSDEPSPSDITVSFYGLGVPQAVTPMRIDFLVQRLLSGQSTNIISGQTVFSINPGVIAPFCSASDRPWIAGPVSLTPNPKGAILVATLACPTWNLIPSPGIRPSADPCVAVWVGP